MDQPKYFLHRISVSITETFSTRFIVGESDNRNNKVYCFYLVSSRSQNEFDLREAELDLRKSENTICKRVDRKTCRKHPLPADIPRSSRPFGCEKLRRIYKRNLILILVLVRLIAGGRRLNLNGPLTYHEELAEFSAKLLLGGTFGKVRPLGIRGILREIVTGNFSNLK